jgi:glycosyltransferase involved in cell wall biosynthesis
MRIVLAGPYPVDETEVKGGVEAVMLYLTPALAKLDDIELHVVSLDINAEKPRSLTKKNYTVHFLPYSKLPARLSLLGNIRTVRRAMCDLKPQIIHAQIAGEYGLAAAKTGIPWVLTLHGIRYLEADFFPGLVSSVYRRRVIKYTELQTIRKTRHLISISPFIQGVFEKHLNCEIYDIENPVADAFFKNPNQEEEFRILFAGRLIPRKGIHTLLEAFERVHRQLPQARLRLAGSGNFTYNKASYVDEQRQFLKHHGLQDAVSFLGELEEPALLEEYSKCCLLVLSSVLETAPMVIMQAMAAGKPVVTTDAGGARYLVQDKQSGFVVPKEDPEALSQAISDVLTDSVGRKKMAELARNMARRRFHADVVAAKTRDVYLHILEK